MLQKAELSAFSKTYREETNTCYNDSADMIPAEWSLVDFSERETSSLVGIRNVCIVVMEVVEGRVASSGSGGHC